MKTLFFFMCLSGCATVGDIRYSEQAVGMPERRSFNWNSSINKVGTIVNQSKKFLSVDMTCRTFNPEDRRFVLSPGEETRFLVRTTLQYEHVNVCEPVVK